tara:strand:+ start:146 stop:2101 length:1956 start_codon:yes stop_codon:yes gene_type:complete
MIRLTIAASLALALSSSAFSQGFDGKDQIHLRDLLEMDSFVYTSGVDYMEGYRRSGQFSDAEVQKYVSKAHQDLKDNVIWRLNHVLPKLNPEQEILLGQIEHCFKMPRGTQFEVQRAKSEIVEWLATQKPEASDRDFAYFMAADGSNYDFDSKAFAFSTMPITWGETDFTYLLPRDLPLTSMNVLSGAQDLRREFRLFLGEETVWDGRVEWKIPPSINPEEVANRLADREKLVLLIEGSRAGATFTKISPEQLARHNEVRPTNAVAVSQVSLWLFNKEMATFERVSNPISLAEATVDMKTVSVEAPEYFNRLAFLYKEGDFAPRPPEQPAMDLAAEPFPSLPDQVGLMQLLQDERSRITQSFLYDLKTVALDKTFFAANEPDFARAVFKELSSKIASNQVRDFPWHFDISSRLVRPDLKTKAMDRAIQECFEIKKGTDLEEAKRAEIAAWLEEIGHHPPLDEQWLLVGFKLDDYDTDRKAFKINRKITKLEQEIVKKYHLSSASRNLDLAPAMSKVAGFDEWPFLDHTKITTTWRLILNDQLHDRVEFFLPMNEEEAPGFAERFGQRPTEGLFVILQGKVEGVHPSETTSMIHGEHMDLAFNVHRVSAWSLDPKGLIATKIGDDLDPDTVLIPTGDSDDYFPVPGGTEASE